MRPVALLNVATRASHRLKGNGINRVISISTPFKDDRQPDGASWGFEVKDMATSIIISGIDATIDKGRGKSCSSNATPIYIGKL